MFKAPARQYKAIELRKTNASETILGILQGIELNLPQGSTLSDGYRDSLIYASPVIVHEPLIIEEDKRNYKPARLVSGFVSYKIMLKSSSAYNAVAISNRDVSDDFLSSLAWCDLVRSLAYFSNQSYGVLFKRLQRDCPSDVQQALFGGKLTQQRFLKHINISKHTLQQSIRSHTEKSIPVRPSMPTLAELLTGEGEHE